MLFGMKISGRDRSDGGARRAERPRLGCDPGPFGSAASSAPAEYAAQPAWLVHGKNRAIGEVTLVRIAMGARQDGFVGAASGVNEAVHGSWLLWCGRSRLSLGKVPLLSRVYPRWACNSVRSSTAFR